MGNITFFMQRNYFYTLDTSQHIFVTDSVNNTSSCTMGSKRIVNDNKRQNNNTTKRQLVLPVQRQTKQSQKHFNAMCSNKCVKPVTAENRDKTKQSSHVYITKKLINMQTPMFPPLNGLRDVNKGLKLISHHFTATRTNATIVTGKQT